MPAAVNGIVPREGPQVEEEQRLRRERREKMRQLQQDLDPRLDYEVRLCSALLQGDSGGGGMTPGSGLG